MTKTDRQAAKWLRPGDELSTLGAAVVRVVKTRSGECRLEVETDDLFQWSIAKDVDRTEASR
jgi:hypothetical protein